MTRPRTDLPANPEPVLPIAGQLDPLCREHVDIGEAHLNAVEQTGATKCLKLLLHSQSVLFHSGIDAAPKTSKYGVVYIVIGGCGSWGENAVGVDASLLVHGGERGEDGGDSGTRMPSQASPRHPTPPD